MIKLSERQQTLARTIDHTLLKPDATPEQVQQLCREALEYGFFSVCINPSYISIAKNLLNGSTTALCTVIGFPLGAMTTAAKVAETRDALSLGATEIDMVLHIGRLRAGEYQYVLDDIVSVHNAVQEHGALLKVIVETSLLDTTAKLAACKAVSESGAEFIKTSTGFAGGGATIEDIRLMRQHCRPEVRIKASGGIRTLQFAEELLAHGANRLGASAGVQILNAAVVDESTY
jgi:deoxyribose-phosphate aldolase